MRRVLLVCLLALALPAAANARPGDIDPTFSRDGYTRIGFGDADAEATAVAIDPEGRIIVAGTTGGIEIPAVQHPLAIAVARLLPSGELDPTFSQDGKQRLEVGASPAVRDVAIDAGGRIVIGASAGGDLLAIRLLADGTPDQAFSGDGVASADAGATERGGALLLDPDGSAIVGGGSCTPSSCRFALARFGTTGAPDTSFGGDGLVVTTFPGDWVTVNALGAVPGGGLYAGGSTGGQEAAIARYTDSGELDTTYNGTGLVIISENTAGARRIFVDPTGGIVGVGDYGALYRVTPQANRDPSFGGAYLARGSLGLDPGRYYLGAGSIGGCSRGCSPTDTAVSRADISTGHLDRSFGAQYYEGLAVVDLDAKPDGALAVTADTDHRPVTAGYSGNEVAVARLEAEDGPADRDGDGVLDDDDLCLMRFAAKGTDGCPVNRRRITMHRRERADLWVGKITSPEARCNFNQTVRVYRRQPGKDEPTAKVTSEGDGGWSADGNLRRGEYYARLNAYLKERYGYCTKARSHVVTIGS